MWAMTSRWADPCARTPYNEDLFTENYHKKLILSMEALPPNDDDFIKNSIQINIILFSSKIGIGACYKFEKSTFASQARWKHAVK